MTSSLLKVVEDFVLNSNNLGLHLFGNSCVPLLSRLEFNSSSLVSWIGDDCRFRSINNDHVTTDASLSGTWRLLWTTEKEQLFIIKNASFFGTKAGDVLQVIDVEKRKLNNVRSNMDMTSSQRVNFRYAHKLLDSSPLLFQPMKFYLKSNTNCNSNCCICYTFLR
ncbi:hypothetical protein L2E82_13095 [Cichorium intybus]|uniref:Uncharacterized protein n=1 Tax=Cichorium intybus TaxID=13427 RepID=A0ACB9GJ03_CICIN|nr:hypothetical protein L2E82_13095 [Cichorium intybus]